MDHQDTLVVFAEISVAFAGFAGLAGLLARRLSGDAAALATARLRGTVEWALLVLAFAVLPLVFLAFAPATVWVWRGLSFALAASAVAYMSWARRYLRSLPWGRRAYRILIVVWILGAALVLLINGLGLLGREAPFYLVGLAAYLLVAMLLFVRLLRSLFSQGTEDGRA